VWQHGSESIRFFWRAAGSEHHMPSTRRVFKYVLGRRVGMDDTCYFYPQYEKIWTSQPPSFRPTSTTTTNKTQQNSIRIVEIVHLPTRFKKVGIHHTAIVPSLKKTVGPELAYFHVHLFTHQNAML